MLERLFDLRGHGTTVRTEVLAGLTTFLTMAYIVVVNPAILGAAGMPVAAVAVATCLASGIGCILMGLLSNYPLALAPGMGLNAYFTYTVVKGMGLPWQTALGCVFISGVAFLVLTIAGVRQLIVRAVPRPLFAAVAGGIGLFIAFIGLADAGIVIPRAGTMVSLGSLTAPTAALAMLGLLVIAALQARGVRGAILLGILLTAAIAWVSGLSHFSPGAYSLSDLSAAAFKLDVRQALNWTDPGMAIPAFLTVIIIPLTYSIANGLAFGITSHAILKLVRGQARPGDWLVYLLAALCIARFIYLA